MVKLILTVFVCVLLTSCYSYKIFPAEFRGYHHTGDPETAFVANPEMTKEYSILAHSGIYNLTKDSLAAGCVKIKLLRFKRTLSCGEPILASLITLGQLPVLFPDKYQYAFEIVNANDTLTRKFELHIAQRTWFWDMFVFHKKFKEKAGQALFAEYYNQTSTILTKR